MTAPAAEPAKAPIGFHWGYAACALLMALIGLIVVSNTTGAWLAVGTVIIAIPVLGLLLSAGFRNVEGSGPAGGFIVKLPAYLLLGVFMLIAAAFSSYIHRQVSDDH